MRKYKLGLILAACLASTGCGDRIELENRGFIVSLGIDKYNAENRSFQGMEGARELNRYTVCAVMPNVMDMKEDAMGDKSKEVKSADSATVWGCIKLMDGTSSQKLYLGQAKLLVLGNGILSDGILFRQAIDAMERNHDVNQKLYLLSTKDRAEGVLRLSLPGEPMLGVFMVNYYKNNGSSGSISFYKVLGKTVSDLRSTGCTLIPEIKGSDKGGGEDESKEGPKSMPITLGGCAVIKDYKLAGWLNDLETRGYEWAMGNCRDTDVTAFYDNGYLALKVYGSKPKIAFEQRNGRLACVVRVKVSGAIQEHDFGGAELFTSDKRALEAVFEQAVSDEIRQTASRLQSDLGADAYNFKDLLRKKDYQLYLAYSDDWERHFREMEIIPDIKVDIISIGIIR